MLPERTLAKSSDVVLRSLFRVVSTYAIGAQVLGIRTTSSRRVPLPLDLTFERILTVNLQVCIAVARRCCSVRILIHRIEREFHA